MIILSNIRQAARLSRLFFRVGESAIYHINFVTAIDKMLQLCYCSNTMIQLGGVSHEVAVG